MSNSEKIIKLTYKEDGGQDIFDVDDFKASTFKVSVSPLSWKQRNIIHQVLPSLMKQIGVTPIDIEYSVISSDKDSEEVSLPLLTDFHKTKFCKIKSGEGRLNTIFQILLPEDLYKNEEGNPIHASTFYSLKHVVTEYEITGIKKKDNEFINSFALLMLKLAYAHKIKYIASILIEDNRKVYVQGIKED
jgi:hypothetical protein